MKIEEAIEVLRYHNEWRVGKKEKEKYSGAKLTEAIDIVLSNVDELPEMMDKLTKVYDYLILKNNIKAFVNLREILNNYNKK